jgi:hypothetical protein
LDDLGDTGRSTHKDYIVDLAFAHARILDTLFYGGDTLGEVGITEFFEFGSGDGHMEVHGFSKRVNFDGSLGGRGKNSLGLFTLGSKSSHSSWVASNIDLVFSEEVSSTVFSQFGIEIFSSQMGVTSSGLHFKDTIFNGQKRDIESSSS